MNDAVTPQPTAAEKLARIQQHLDAGGVGQTLTYTRATLYSRKHRDWFTVSGNDLYVRQGKRKVCLNFTPIRFGRYTT
jgi:hypothetical protein